MSVAVCPSIDLLILKEKLSLNNSKDFNGILDKHWVSNLDVHEGRYVLYDASNIQLQGFPYLEFKRSRGCHYFVTLSIKYFF